MTPAAELGGRSGRGMDLALFILAVGLAGVTALTVSVPATLPAIVNDRLSVTAVTAGTLVALAVAALDWARGRVAREAGALLQGSAFAVLATLNALALVMQLAGTDVAFGGSLEAPGQLPLVAAFIGQGAGALLFVAAGVATLRGATARIRAAVLVIGPAAVVGGTIVLAALLHDRLPVLVSPSTLTVLARNPEAAFAPGSAPALVLVESAIGMAFLVATALAHRAYRRSGRTGDALLAAGFVIAAFSQVHGSLHPGGYTALVTTGDLLRLAFFAVVVAGVVTDRRDDLRELRLANAEVRRLAAVQLATAALEERARLAREIHDGLAQDLWYAKLKQSRLAQLADFREETRQLSDEVGDAIDAALAEARHAVVAMRAGSDAGPLLEMITRQVEDFSDRFAIAADLTIEGPAPEIGPRAEAEVTRIVQEALTNVRKHADATVVRIRVTSDAGLRLVVSDNGRGFGPGAASGFGLESMRQRAELIGASLSVSSEPQNGTLVELIVPIERSDLTDGA